MALIGLVLRPYQIFSPPEYCNLRVNKLNEEKEEGEEKTTIQILKYQQLFKSAKVNILVHVIENKRGCEINIQICKEKSIN